MPEKLLNTRNDFSSTYLPFVDGNPAEGHGLAEPDLAPSAGAGQQFGLLHPLHAHRGVHSDIHILNHFFLTLTHFQENPFNIIFCTKINESIPIH